MRRALLVLVLGAAACSGGSSASSASRPPATATPSATASASTVLPTATVTPTAPALSPSPPMAPTSPPPAVPACLSGQLRLSIGPQQGAAGTTYQPLVLTNRGAACSLRGFPGVSFLDAAGRQIGSPAATSGQLPHRVLLRPGGSAQAQLAIGNAGNYPDSDCAPRPATRVRVYPPGERVALTAEDEVDVCSVPTARQLRIDPVSPR